MRRPKQRLQVMTNITVDYLADSFVLLSTLYIDCDEAEELQLAEVAIEIESARALEKRVLLSRAIAKQLEIKILAVDRLIIKRVVERLGYYALPLEIEGENDKGLLNPEFANILKRHYQSSEVWDEDFQLREQLAKILTLVDDE